MKRKMTLASIAMGAALLTPFAASTAVAAGSSPAGEAHVVTPMAAGDCPTGKFCFFYNSGLAGAHNALSSNVPNLAGYTFTSSGAGSGQAVKNNAASAQNNNQCKATVYFNSNYAGVQDSFLFRNGGQLVNTYNQNASLFFASFCG
ncbi:peptidase inhibitor family I36 protein [Streptomyces sp. NPDC057697]|uniref:peptidase inhibitor family I36 protein n=1 Tax=Streptomyces sp. NPDC057697 TaxID=3346219 RepID=UPI003689ECA3